MINNMKITDTIKKGNWRLYITSYAKGGRKGTHALEIRTGIYDKVTIEFMPTINEQCCGSDDAFDTLSNCLNLLRDMIGRMCDYLFEGETVRCATMPLNSHSTYKLVSALIREYTGKYDKYTRYRWLYETEYVREENLQNWVLYLVDVEAELRDGNGTISKGNV